MVVKAFIYLEQINWNLKEERIKLSTAGPLFQGIPWKKDKYPHLCLQTWNCPECKAQTCTESCVLPAAQLSPRIWEPVKTVFYKWTTLVKVPHKTTITFLPFTGCSHTWEIQTIAELYKAAWKLESGSRLCELCTGVSPPLSSRTFQGHGNNSPWYRQPHMLQDTWGHWLLPIGNCPANSPMFPSYKRAFLGITDLSCSITSALNSALKPS